LQAEPSGHEVLGRRGLVELLLRCNYRRVALSPSLCGRPEDRGTLSLLGVALSLCSRLLGVALNLGRGTLSLCSRLLGIALSFGLSTPRLGLRAPRLGFRGLSHYVGGTPRAFGAGASLFRPPLSER